MKIYLETERIFLREFTSEDIKFIDDLDSSPAVMKYLSDGVPSSKDQVLNTINSFLKCPDREGGSYGYWLAQTKDSKEFVGWFQLRPLKEDINNYKVLEIGYRLKEKFWGQGITTEVSEALINKAFNELDAKEVWAITMRSNIASQKVMEKCGLEFQREDVFLDYPGKDKRCVWYRLKDSDFRKHKLNSLVYRKSALSDALAAAKLHSVGDPEAYDSLVPVFQNEFKMCDEMPDIRSYYLAFDKSCLIAFAGARYYDQENDESMYGTKNLLPSGWYLRGIRVHKKWQRLGIARELTKLRLEWLKEKSSEIFVFLSDENKETLPMYKDLGFLEQSKGWTYSSPKISRKGILLKGYFNLELENRRSL